MRLNPDCIRDILLEVEENTDLTHSISFKPWSGALPARLSRYSPDELAYHIMQCDLHGYFEEMHNFVDEYDVSFLSPAGHAFLSDIRSDTVWNHTKTVAGKIGAWSLDALTKIATGVVTELIKTQLSVP